MLPLTLSGFSKEIVELGLLLAVGAVFIVGALAANATIRLWKPADAWRWARLRAMTPITLMPSSPVADAGSRSKRGPH